MIKVTDDLIKHLERLSRIGLSEKERSRLKETIQEVLDYMKLLDEVNLEGIEPMYTPIESNMPLRKDEVVGFSSEEIVSRFPDSQENQAKVPPILG